VEQPQEIVIVPGRRSQVDPQMPPPPGSSAALRHNHAVIARARAIAAATAPDGAHRVLNPTCDELLAAMRTAMQPVAA
jgi:hypothetical protein